MAATLEQISDGVFETDFLIIGGGLVGTLAAIRARKNSKDMDITVIDKATMEYSGDGAAVMEGAWIISIRFPCIKRMSERRKPVQMM